MREFRIVAVLCLLVCAGHVETSLADDMVQQYAIKQSAPSTGTSLVKEIVKAGPIPLKKQFAELTPEQKALLRAEYDHMPDQDEPPFPVKGLYPIYKAIAIAHENLGLEFLGPVSAYVLVDRTGAAKSVEVTASPSDDISTVVTYALMNAKYKPAVCNSQPCEMQMAIHAELVSPISSSTPGKISDMHLIPQY